MDHFHRANTLCIDEFYEEAVAAYSAAATTCPDYGDIYAYRAGAYIKLKKHMSALEDCNRALQMNPKCERCYFKKG